MAQSFSYFVILAELRTGSNLLESYLNQIDDVTCHGEDFNPGFIGDPKRAQLLGVSLAARRCDPAPLLERLARAEGLRGLRFFHDHQPEALNLILRDRRCAKVILSRDNLRSYLSWKIARQTGQWQLMAGTERRRARVRFDAQEFAAFSAERSAFRSRLRRRLTELDQRWFRIDYADLGQLSRINALVRWLGASGALSGLKSPLKRQNPSAPEKLVTNPDDMRRALSARQNAGRYRGQRRSGPMLRRYLLAPEAPLLFQPMPGGPYWSVRRALRVPRTMPRCGALTRQSLAALRAARPELRSFTVLRHPVQRAFRVFGADLLTSAEPRAEVGPVIARTALAAPGGRRLPRDGLTQSALRDAFLHCLRLVEAELTAHDGPLPDVRWCTQADIIDRFSHVAPPDAILHEGTWQHKLSLPLAAPSARAAPGRLQHERISYLDQIYDREIEVLAQRIFARDYQMFGFGDYAR